MEPFEPTLNRLQGYLDEIDRNKRQPASALDDIMKDEGFRDTVYDDLTSKPLTQEDIINKRYKGKPTIGYGQVLTPEELEAGMIQGKSIYGGVDEEFAKKLAKENEVNKLVARQVNKIEDLPTSEKEALQRAGYNIGPTAIGRIVSTYKKDGKEAAGDRLVKYIRSGGKVLGGLVKRRISEANQLVGYDRYEYNPRKKKIEVKKKENSYQEGGLVIPELGLTPDELDERRQQEELDRYSMLDFAEPVDEPVVDEPTEREAKIEMANQEVETREDGLNNDMPTGQPKNDAPKDRLSELISKYENAQERDTEAQKFREYGNLGIDIANQLSKFAAMRREGNIQRAGAMRSSKFEAPQFRPIATPETSYSDRVMQKMKMLRDYQNLVRPTARSVSTKQIKTVNEKGEPVIKLIDNAGNLVKEFKAPRPKSVSSKTYKIDTVNEQGKPVTVLYDATNNKKIQEFQTPTKELTPYQKQYLDVYKKAITSKEERAEESRKLREQKEERLKTQKQKDREMKANENIYRVTKDFEGNALKKELDKQGVSFEQANQLMEQIESGNEIALGALGTKMARAMGEVGVLTDADVKRYIQSQSLLRRGKDEAVRLGQGRMYEESLKDMKEVVNKMMKGFKKKEKDVFQRYVDRAYENFGKQAGLSKQDIYNRFGMGYKSPQKDMKMPTADQVSRYAEQYGLSPQQAEQILIKRLNR